MGSRATASSCSSRSSTTSRRNSEDSVMKPMLLTPERRAWILGLAAIATVAGGVLTARQAATDPQSAVNAAFKQFQNLKEGKNADYIPALAKVDPNLFGIALVTVDGKVFTAGDVKTEVSI